MPDLMFENLISDSEQFNILLKLAIAMLLGALIGFEREAAEKKSKINEEKGTIKSE